MEDVINVARALKFRVWDKWRKVMYPVTGLDWRIEGPSDIALDSIWSVRPYMDGVGIEVSLADGTLMQFTGLHDSQGHEIYEGDILRLTGEKETLAVVEFVDGAFKARNGPDSIAWLDVVLTAADESIVVGNRFENPELEEKCV